MLIAEGRQAEVLRRPDGTVVKLMRETDDHRWVEREAAALRAVEARGISVPRVVEVLEVDGRPGLAMTHVEGDDLFGLVASRPWRVRSLARSMGTLHATLHGLPAPEVLPSTHDVLTEDIQEADTLSGPQRDAALAALATLPTGDGLSHGDMHFGNLLGDPRHPVVIDWGGATRGDPTADVALTVLMHRMARPGPGTPGLVRAVAPVGARLIVGAYLAAYRRDRPLDGDLLERWIVVRAAARLTHGIEDEDAGLRSVVAAAFGP